MATIIQDGGIEVRVEVHVDVDGFLLLRTFDDATGAEVTYFPRMTSFEAGLLARDLERAAEKADRT